MRVNRILFSKLSAQYELLKMRAAYVMAEQFLIQESENTTTSTAVDSTPESMYFETASFEYNKPLSQQEQLHQLLLKYEEVIRDILNEERYEDMNKAMDTYNSLLSEWKSKYGNTPRDGNN